MNQATLINKAFLKNHPLRIIFKYLYNIYFGNDIITIFKRNIHSTKVLEGKLRWYVVFFGFYLYGWAFGNMFGKHQ